MKKKAVNSKHPAQRSKSNRPTDVNEIAHLLVEQSTTESVPARTAARIVEITTGQPSPKKNPAAVSLGRLGGLKGGKVRAEKLSEERRHQIASAAARARWAKEKRD